MTWQETLQNYFKTHPTLNDENRGWLQKNVLLDLDQLIEDMSADQIVTVFNRKVKGANVLNNSLLIRTLIWQGLGQILAGLRDPLMGNLRSFWYEFADPIYSGNDLYQELSSQKDPEFKAFLVSRQQKAIQALLRRKPALVSALGPVPPSGLMKPPSDSGIPSISQLETKMAKRSHIENLCEDCIQEFVTREIFRYQGPFQFMNHNKGAGLVGSRASLLFFVEKEGLKDKYCSRYFKKYNISVLWSEGQPSFLMCESFADQLRAKKVARIAFGGLVDYDAAGFSIARTYRNHFEKLGFATKGFTILTTPALFTEASLEKKSSPIDRPGITKDKKTMNDKWFAETGGINGKRRGIHVNHATESRVDKAVEAWYRQAIKFK